MNVILNVPLIYLWGLNGAMVATSISEFSVTAYQLFAVRHLLNFKDLFHGSWKYFISSFLMFIVVFWMNRNLRDTWLMMFVEILVGVLIYGVLVIVLRAPIVAQAKMLIKNRFSK